MTDTPQDSPLTRLEEQLLRADIKANRPMSAWSVVRLLATLDEARSLPAEPGAPTGETWRCPGCRDTTAPMGMCQTCGVFGLRYEDAPRHSPYECYVEHRIQSMSGEHLFDDGCRLCDWSQPQPLPAEPVAPSVRHGRHCPCSACYRTDWMDPRIASCDYHPGVRCPYDPAPSPVPEAAPHRPDGAHWPSCRTCDEDWPCRAALAEATPPALDVRLVRARDLTANFLWNEDDSGDEDQLGRAYDLLVEVLGHSTEESVGQTLAAEYAPSTDTPA
jgi:hypothetical protein